MRVSLLAVLLLSLSSPVLAAGNPCAPGTLVADDCQGVTFAGCCTNEKTVRWCQNGNLCELSCVSKPACGWKSGAGVYDCGAIPKGDPSCDLPYSCTVGGCAPAWEDKGCCDCPCEDCVCSKDPYCCQTSWDPVCVNLCAECGGCGSPDGCTPAPTAGCQGCTCESCVCAIDVSCCIDKWDSICAGLCAEQCNGGCEVCQADCSGKECGEDGCLGLCGVCPNNYECVEGSCEKKCVPSCVDRECGLDSCGLKSCGTCEEDSTCNKYNKCILKPCEPDCEGKVCGSDTCSGSCGTCEEGVPCIDGTCIPDACAPQCAGKQCGDDGCGGQCGYCPPETICNKDLGKCTIYCKPNCDNKQCGDDGCGETCGDCSPGLACTPDPDGSYVCKAPCFPICQGKQCGDDHCAGSCGTCPPETPHCSGMLGGVCTPTCIPDCLGKECGDDNCGGSCGQCPGDWICQTGMCVPPGSCMPQCLVPPDYFTPKQCGWDECPGQQNVCGVCPLGFYCAVGYICVEDFCSCDGKECGEPNPGCPPCGECLEGESCSPDTFECIPCQPSCLTEQGISKQCGDDDCEGSCGDCPVGYTCDETDLDGDPATFMCKPCVPNCLNNFSQVKMCGSDGCGGVCGQCPPQTPICVDDNNEGTCVPCQSTCDNPFAPGTLMECGPDACPSGCLDLGFKPCTSAGDCDIGQQCNAQTGMCVQCGSCGNCYPPTVCDVDPTDVDDPGKPLAYYCRPCTPNCLAKECGPNGCGGTCGVCPAGFNCCLEGDENCGNIGTCYKDCNPSAGCFGKECGPNGCPDGCLNPVPQPCNTDGTCTKKGLFCDDGTNMCTAQDCGKFGECPEGLYCDPNQNLCTGCGSCGTCSDNEYCAPGYICQLKPADPCTDNGWVCGKDADGNSCGTCEEPLVCDSHQCIEQGGEDISDDVDTVEQPDEDIEPDKVTPDIDTGNGNQPITCPQGKHYYLGICVDNEAPKKKKSGCSSSTVPGNGGWLVLLTLLALAGLAHRRRIRH